MVQLDTIIRSNRKTLAISVDAFGRLIVRAPKKCDEDRIFAFLQTKERWILRKQAERKGAGMDLPPENLDGYTFLLLGKNTKICLYDNKKVGYDSENNCIFLPKEKSKERLVKWLKENAKRILTQVTECKAKEMGLSYKSLSITSARTRWGTCSGDNALRYTFRLLYCPKEIIRVFFLSLSDAENRLGAGGLHRGDEDLFFFWKEAREQCCDLGGGAVAGGQLKLGHAAGFPCGHS